MTPRLLHRWKSFWLGLFVLLFLGWAWTRSLGHVDGFNWMRKGIMITAGHGYGSIDLSWDPSRAPSSLEMFQWLHEPITGTEVPEFAKAVNWEHYESQIIQMQVAYWLIILVFLLLWAAWLFLYQKRERRKSSS